MIRLTLTEKQDPKQPLALFVFENEADAAAKAEGFKGKAGTAAVLHPKNGKPSHLLVLVGLGERKKADLEKVRKAAALAYKKMFSLSQSAFALRLPEFLDAKSETAAAVEGLSLAGYSFDKYKQKKKDDFQVKEVFVVSAKAGQQASKDGFRIGKILAEAASFVRDLVNEPPSDLTPLQFAAEAKKIAQEGKSAGVTIQVFDKDDIEKMKMGAVLGVNRGSAEPPVFIHMHYKPQGAKKSVAFVGKGITFDSGGLSLKSPQNMETMKMDMAGAASILGTFKAIAELKPKVEVHGIMVLTENMPGGRASKPGDVLRSMSGKSIEVLNTDAEGRLVLADALHYAVQQKPDAVIDIATLTGACIIALGSLVAGAMGNNDDLFKEIDAASKETGEKFWQLPLVEEYKDGIKSPIADVKNISSIRGEAGSIIGGLFLQEFMDERPWIHLDIAGPAWTDRELPYCKHGGTGFPTRTLIQYLLKQK